MKIKKMYYILALMVLGIGVTVSLSSFIEAKDSGSLNEISTTLDDGGSENNPLFDKIVLHTVTCPAQTVTYISYYRNESWIGTVFSNGTSTGQYSEGTYFTHTITGSIVIPAYTTGWNECIPENSFGCTPCLPATACTVGCNY